MTELERIDSAWREAQQRGETGVLATVVRVAGSTYRRPGARLLLTSGGRKVGSVSGGCLEADLAKKAWWLTEDGRAIVRAYDTTGEGDEGPAFGLGCQGMIHVLVERLGSAVSPLVAAPEIKVVRMPARMATIIDSNSESRCAVGQRVLRLPGGEWRISIEDQQVRDFACAAVCDGRDASPHEAVFLNETFRATVFVETFAPALRLIVVGAGDDAVPLTRLARLMGYEVVVVDGRSHFAQPNRFPEADNVRVATRDEPLAGIVPDTWTAVVLMSHSYAQDLAALRSLKGIKLPYLGLLGPRRRAERLLTDAGAELSEVESALHSPVGLDIGADGAEQIALAVIAELQSALNHRAGGRLREKAGPLHVSGAGEHYETSLVCPADQ